METTTLDQNHWIYKVAKIGIGAKGLVYCLAGIIIFLSVYDIITKKAGDEITIEYLANQPFGKVLLFLLAIGLTAHFLWRIFQGFSHTEMEGFTANGSWQKISYLLSGLVYGILAYTAFKLSFTGHFGGDKNGHQQLINMVLAYNWGAWLIILIGVGFIGKAIWQFHRALSGNFVYEMPKSGFNKMIKQFIRRIGFFGYLARGIAYGLLGYFFVRAAINPLPASPTEKTGAFWFLEYPPLGPFLLSVLAIGLICYGYFMFVKAKYSKLSI